MGRLLVRAAARHCFVPSGNGALVLDVLLGQLSILTSGFGKVAV